MNSNRPLSPHLQIYKLPLTGIISITHRITGIMLSAGLIFVVYIVSAIAGGSETYATMQEIINSWPCKIIYWGFIYALFFHLCHGIRHLIWDAGAGFQPDTLNRYAVYELIASLTLTITTLTVL